MTGAVMANPFFSALTAAICCAVPAAAQDYDPAVYILDLQPKVRELVPTIVDLSGEGRAIADDAREMVERSGDIQMRQDGDKIILSVASDVLFGFDSADLSANAQRSLTDVAALITRSPDGQVLVTGHTDAKGSDAYNLTLSQRRAQAVADFLIADGVPSARLATEGRGESQPAAENEINGADNPEGRALNRRVEFVLPRAMLD